MLLLIVAVKELGSEDIILFGSYDAELFKQNFAELDLVTQRVLQLISEETPIRCG